jgi:hypothetical protein
MTIAHFNDIVFDHTAGQTLLATSFAHIFIAMYNHNIIAIGIYILNGCHQNT